jgi:hypothetical protein
MAASIHVRKNSLLKNKSKGRKNVPVGAGAEATELGSRNSDSRGWTEEESDVDVVIK